METRKYTLRKRAEAQDETRARIVDATVALHEELGPRKATISAIAERAGVQRLTVYRHFPDEFALFAACTSQWLADNPPPVPTEWSELRDAGLRARAALNALYAYYRRTEKMWAVSYRDADDVPAVRQPLQAFDDYLTAVQRSLIAGVTAGARSRRLKAVIGHLLRFATWQSLVRRGQLSDAEGAAIGAGWIDAALRERDARA